MHRELIAHPHVASFSACLLAAFVAGYLLARFNATSSGIKGRHIDNQALLMAALSLFGARFFSWVFYFPGGTSFWAGMTASGGGLVFYGGMVFAIAAAVAYSLLTKLPLRRIADVWAAPVALGLAIGRVGCFLAGCCWGDVCLSSDQATALDRLSQLQIHSVPILSGSSFPLAMRFPRETGAFEQHQALGLISPTATLSLPVHPTQLYEAVAVLGLAILLQRQFANRENSGLVFFNLILGYSTIRFLVEFVRADSPPIYFGLTLSQVISVCFLLGAVPLRVLCSERTVLSEPACATILAK